MMSNNNQEQKIIFAAINAKINVLVSILSKKEYNEYLRLMAIEKQEFLAKYPVCSLDESSLVDDEFGKF